MSKEHNHGLLVTSLPRRPQGRPLSRKVMMGASIRDNIKEMATSGWMMASWTLGLLGVLNVAALFVTPYAPGAWTRLAEHLNPGVDAPDNWALGISYCVKMASTLFLASTVLAAVGLWQIAKRQRRGITKPGT